MLDIKTGLMWAVEDNGKNIDWKNAKNYCESYRGGGHDNWRMPTQDELHGLYTAGIRMGKSIIIRLTNWRVWASETRGSSGAVVGFYYGDRGFVHQSDTVSGRALPVRAGK